MNDPDPDPDPVFLHRVIHLPPHVDGDHRHPDVREGFLVRGTKHAKLVRFGADTVWCHPRDLIDLDE